MNWEQIYKFVGELWHEDTQPATLAAHLCFLVVSSFAFFFVPYAGLAFELTGTIFREGSIDVITRLITWSNFFLNLLFLLIIIDISQIISNAYYNYKRDNL